MRDFIDLFFPRLCCVCGTPLVGDEREICTSCLFTLPEAMTADGDSNLVERRLMGRLPIEHATALLYFKRGTSSQSVLHQIKYHGNRRLALLMGRQLGLRLSRMEAFADVDMLVPVPLHRSKERHRGYNQSLLLCQGIQQTFPRPVSTDNLTRIKKTATQTKKNRQQRLENMKDVFKVNRPDMLKGHHLLLVDDVITTGATTEACYEALKGVEGLKISIAALAVSGDY